MTPTSIRLCDPHHPALNLRKWGDGARACVLIHGFGEGGFVWDEFALRLATDCAVLAMDLRGHADSEWDIEARYDLEAHTMDLQRLIGASTQDDIVLVGHSMGAAIALRLAARHERIAELFSSTIARSARKARSSKSTQVSRQRTASTGPLPNTSSG